MLVNVHENHLKIEFDRKKFEELCALQYQLREIPVEFETSQATLERAIRRHYHRDPWTVVQQRRVPGIIQLRLQARQLAHQGNASLLIFLSK